MRSFRVIVLAFVLGVAGRASAQSAHSAADADRAQALYAEALAHLQAGRADQALVALDGSIAAQSSPNTHLLRGHALRTLGRRVEAMQAYERVVSEAGERVRGGDARFDATLADAGRWVAVLRTELGELAIEVRGSERPQEMRVGREPVQFTHDARAKLARARLWHEPGRASVSVGTKGAGVRRREVEILAGATQSVVFDLTPPPAPPRAPAKQPSRAPPAASLVALGVGAAGFATFAVAGGLAVSKFGELDECRPDCSEQDTNDARTKATVANVGLVVGVAGLATGGAIWLLAETSRPRAPVTGVRVGLSVLPGAAGLSLSARH